VTESYAAGVPFFVWAEVSAWRTQGLSDGLQTYEAVEKSVGEAGSKAGLSQAFPFVITGRPELIDFNIVNATPDTVPGMEAHKKIQIPFELHSQDVTLVGFGRASIRVPSRQWARICMPTSRRWTTKFPVMYRASSWHQA
jgi:hypothetical protein